MFRKFIEMLKKGDLMKQALEDSYTMFDHSVKLFEVVTQNFFGEPLPEGFDVYREDRLLNNMERGIRRKILEHLSINPRQDIVGALVLTTVIVHMERIGDYSKNIYELIEKKNYTTDCKYYNRAEVLARKLIPSCKRATEVYRKSGVEEAKLLIKELNDLKKEFERNIDEIMEEKDITVKNAIIFSLLFRYFKRVTAHTMDILTSVWQPFDLIDFFKEEPTQE